MPKPVTHKTKSAILRSGHFGPLIASGRPLARSGADARETAARQSWVAALRVRKAVQDRIVSAFRRHIDGSGPGPSDAELLMFARLAVAEQRLGRNLAGARVQPGCGGGQTGTAPPPVLRQADQP